VAQVGEAAGLFAFHSDQIEDLGTGGRLRGDRALGPPWLQAESRFIDSEET
jgi:hypothetical protein